MIYANFENNDEMKKNIPLVGIDKEGDIKTSGLQITNDGKKIYILDRLSHSLIIGTSKSGKTQTITLPLLKLSNRAKESVLVYDSKNELYEKTKDEFIKEGYNVIKIDFDNIKECNYWNPLEFPLKLYKDNNKDKSQKMLEELAFYLFNDPEEKNSEPFWFNSIINYFTGIALYAFANEENININTINNVANEIKKSGSEFLKRVDKNSNEYIYLSTILNIAEETRESVFAVFEQKMNKIMLNETLKEKLSKSDFDIINVFNEKTIIYVISDNMNSSEFLMPLLISQICYAKDIYAKNSRKTNIIIDDFFELYPIKNFEKILNYSKNINISFTVIIRGFCDLKKKYDADEVEIIKICFDNIVYLYSQDMYTLTEISDLCGYVTENGVIKSLAPIEELKTLNLFECIILIPRIMPIKTKLLPYYEMKNII